MAVVHSNRGYYRFVAGAYERALTDFKKAIELNSKYSHSWSHWALMRTTASDPAQRDGKQGLKLALWAVELDRSPNNLDTLAGAYAETGQFEKAIDTQTLAIAVLKSKTFRAEMVEYEKRLGLYKSHKPWRRTLNDNAAPNQEPGNQEQLREREDARKTRLRQRIEGLSGKWASPWEGFPWDIRFKGNRFEAYVLGKIGPVLLYDGDVTGIEITGRALLYSANLCRKTETMPLIGHIDLLQQSISISAEKFDIVEMNKHQRCFLQKNDVKWSQKKPQ